MKLPHNFILVFLLFLANLTMKSQVLMHFTKIIKPDFCLTDTAAAKDIIGRKVKIWHEGGVASTLYMNKDAEWPSENIRQEASRSGWGTFKPKTGNIGTIVYIFPLKGCITQYIYLLNIRSYYVPIGCYYLTDIDKPDSYKQAELDWINDSISNVNYAAGCKFKLRNQNNNWSRAGLMNIDKLSENFACDLTLKGIDTVMLCKYISDYGSTTGEKAFILWLDKGQGFVKSYFNNSDHEPTQNKVVLFDSKKLINYFFENKIDTVTTEPQSEIYISHSMGYSIQFYTPGFFFRERLTDFIIREDKTHPKAIWWNMISEQLSALKEE